MILALVPMRAAPPSPFYDFTVVAEPGTSLVGEGAIAAIEPSVSINERGEVAFVAGLIDGSEQLLVVRRPGMLENISRSPAGRNFDFPQINNQGRIVTHELLSGNSLVRLWNVANSGGSQIIASSTLSEFTQVTIPTVGNAAHPGAQPMVGFLGRVADLPFAYFANASGLRNVQDSVSSLSGTTLWRFRAAAADTEKRRFVVQYTDANGTPRIVVYEDAEDLGLWSGQGVAEPGDPQGWIELGAFPGISGSGQLVAFAGIRLADGGGEGIHLAASASGFLDQPKVTAVFGTSDTIAYDDAGQPIRFASFDLESRIGVEHVEAGPPGLEGDWAVISFIATPEKEAWPTTNPNRLKLFTAQPGLWTIRVDFERQFQSADPVALPRLVVPHATSPIRVVQKGDVLRLPGGGAFSVESFAVHDPLAVAGFDSDGTPRHPGRGDHHIAFTASDGAATVVVRGARLDTDEDGLLDHWETPTRGIDADGDGIGDLRLANLGAKPFRKDLFVEIDWLTPRESGGEAYWSNAPAPGVTERMAQVFAEAPVQNPDGSTGITLHVDAGPGIDETFRPYSVNMSAVDADLGGGELVGMPGQPRAHPDLIYFGVPGSLRFEGARIRSLTEVKRQHFENRDRGARELVFKYVLLADHHSAVMSKTPGVVWSPQVTNADPDEIVINSSLGGTNNERGNSVLITHGKGAGQVRKIRTHTPFWIQVREPFDVVPDATSRISLLSSSSGRAEVHFRPFPDYHGHPGNDFTMNLGGWGVNAGGWLVNGEIQWKTLVHELGHTLGLRHGGVDHEAYKGDAYLSLMSYSWQLKEGSPVVTYSDRHDPTFDDWGYIRHDFSNFAYLLGNAFGLRPDGESLFDDYAEPTLEDWERVNGETMDLRPPEVVLVTPAEGAAVPSGRLDVVVQASDETSVEEVLVYFDLDGNGRWDASRGEVKTAAHGGGNSYATSFPGVSGPAGIRKVLAVASDPSENHAADLRNVRGGSGAGAGTVIRESAGTFGAQSVGAPRRSTIVGPISLPSSGLATFTVTAEPAVRQAGQEEGARLDAAVESIRFAGSDIPLRPVCNAPGSSPSVCTSTWHAPAAGNLDVRILGPAILGADGATLAHPSQNYQLTITFQAVDITAPTARVVSPGAGEFAEIGVPLIVDVEAVDDFGVSSVTVECDLNGDGDRTDPGESMAASTTGGGIHRATFGAPTGSAGVRSVAIRAIDSSGLQGWTNTWIELRERDVTAPSIAVVAPPPGWPVRAGDTLTVEISAVDDIGLADVSAAFDLDGNGTIEGPSESVSATKTGVNLYTAVFPAIAGANGPRDVIATAVDPSGNSSAAESIVTVGGVEPVTETIFTDGQGSIPAQSSTGSQQVIPYGSLELPSAGTIRFTVTATPPVRREVPNIPRADPYVRDIVFEGVPVPRLTPTCNAPGSDPAICTTSHVVDRAGTLSFSLLGPGAWNIFGEFVGHAAQAYTLEVEFTATDITPPDVTFAAPARGANLAIGSSLNARVDVTDDGEIASVLVLFDVDGDGDSDDAGERKAAVRTTGDRYRAEFAPISGAPGNRVIEVLATDESFNTRRASISVGTGGVGSGEVLLTRRTGTIPAQPADIQGGRRQIVSVPALEVPGMGRLTFRVESSPPVRREVANIERHDPTVSVIRYNGEVVGLQPQCNPAGSDPAICVSTWDAPDAGTLEIEVLGPAQYNIWGEFVGHAAVDYELTVVHLPGPAVDSVTPSSGSVAGGRMVTMRGAGFALNSVVLFDGIPATGVTRLGAGELTCVTPPGTLGPADVRVINPDPDGLPWNYGVPYGLFGTRAAGFTYQAAPAPGPLDAERLLGTWTGSFAAVGAEEPQGTTTLPFAIPGPGRLRFETHAFVPILNPIPGPFDDPTNLDWHNESAAVRSLRGGNGATYAPDAIECTELSQAYGPVICRSLRVVDAAAAGNGTFTVHGPARWNAFWRQFGEFVMLSAPAQDWATSAWFAAQPTLTSISPGAGTTGTVLTVRGTNFAQGMHVRIGGIEAPSVTLAGATQLTCRIPSIDAGLHDVEIELLGMAARLAAAIRHDGTGGPSDDADHDGLATLVEEFMGLDPETPDAAGALTVEHEAGVLLVTYRRARDTGGIVGWTEWSDDLANWQAGGATEVIIRDVPGEDHVVVAAVLSADPGHARFARLKVAR